MHWEDVEEVEYWLSPHTEQEEEPDGAYLPLPHDKQEVGLSFLVEAALFPPGQSVQASDEGWSEYDPEGQSVQLGESGS